METSPAVREYTEKIKSFIDSKRSHRSPVTDPNERLDLDSLEFIRLTHFIEELTGTNFEDDELTIDNFETLRSIEALLATKRVG
jgi:acyl carrier protein